MQALFFLLFIGFLMSSMAMMLGLVTQSAISRKQLSIEQVEQRFEDVEAAVTKRLLVEYPDVASYDASWSLDQLLTIPIDPWLLENTPWQEDELSLDPWESAYQVRTADQVFAMAQGAITTVTAVLLASPGPDRTFQTILPEQGVVDYRTLLAFEAAADSDDILHVFSTVDALKANWNQIYEASERTANQFLRDYFQQYQRFLPQIDAYYNQPNNSPHVYGSNYTLEESLLAWVNGLPSGCATGSCDVEPMSLASANYPVMRDNLGAVGADTVLSDLPAGFAIGVSQENPCNTATECTTATIIITSTAPTWTVSYSIPLDGRDLISGKQL